MAADSGSPVRHQPAGCPRDFARYPHHPTLHDLGQRNTTYFICFAAGVLIAASFLHIIPKSLSMNAAAPTWLLVGFLALHLFNRFVTAFVCERNPESKDYAIGVIPLLGIGFHSFLDGFIYSIAFNVDILTGSLATLGMVLHEFPEDHYLSAAAARRLRRTQGLAARCVCRGCDDATGHGGLYPFVSAVDPQVLGMLLALSAGALVYVGATICSLVPKGSRSGSACSPSEAAFSWRSSSSSRRPEPNRAFAEAQAGKGTGDRGMKRGVIGLA